MRDEGYVKFDSVLLDAPPPPEWEVEEANRWRDRLYGKGLIGAYDDGIGYGNISTRNRLAGEFLITGTGTGSLPMLFPEHFVRVVDYNIPGNRVVCAGTIHASSESMTHAAVYACDPGIGAVVHVHAADHWRRLLGTIPTTSAAAAYGTPDMAAEILRLYRATDFPSRGVMAMAGHEEGLLSFGADLEEAGARLLDMVSGPQSTPRLV